MLDPGFGFAKLTAHNWSLLRGLERLLQLDHPVLVGTSRKTFLGRVGVAHGRRPAATRWTATGRPRRPPCTRPGWGPGACACTTCPSTLDAMRVAQAIEDAP